MLHAEHHRHDFPVTTQQPIQQSRRTSIQPDVKDEICIRAKLDAHMPEKSKSFAWIKFPPEVIVEALQVWEGFLTDDDKKYGSSFQFTAITASDEGGLSIPRTSSFPSIAAMFSRHTF